MTDLAEDYTASPGATVRVLVGLLVYNGRDFVPRTLASVSAMRAASSHDVDVLILDDASPDPGWSEALRTLCDRLALGYYRSPRNLGIPRNMNLAMLRAETAGYDYVILLNSDVVVPANLIDQLVATAGSAKASSGRRIATVTAWSNNASVFSLPNSSTDDHLCGQSLVNEISSTLESHFSTPDLCVEIPVGMGFCLGISVPAIREIGLMDPVFGRGYCEEVDWCCRASAAGWSHVLAPTTFVYHMGSASTRLAGLLSPGEQTVQTNEAIIDDRYPEYRNRIASWDLAGGISLLKDRAVAEVVRSAALRRGYVLEATWLPKGPSTPLEAVQIRVTPDGSGPIVLAFVDGFVAEIPVGRSGILSAVADYVGVAPAEVRISDHGSVASQISAAARSAGITLVRKSRYPERV